MTGSYLNILKVVLHGRSSLNILVGTVLSFTFSIAVILCTFGLMDGFDDLLKSGLRNASGDILVTTRKGFFSYTEAFDKELRHIHPIGISPVIQSEAFASFGGISKGVLVRGIEPQSFEAATGLKLNVSDNGAILGEELGHQLGLRVGDSFAMTLGTGNEASNSLPGIKLFEVRGFVKHGIYQKDSRFIYLSKEELAPLVYAGDKVNLVILSVEDPKVALKDLNVISDAQYELRKILASDYTVRPFWSEYSYLIEAVKVEKFSISLILQLIVVVAVFNIIAFVIYIMEKKSQEFFFLRAVGLSLNRLMQFWFISITIIWAVSCIGAFILSRLFDLALKYLPMFQVPGEIYVLSSLSIRLNLKAYATVYALSLIWILLAAGIGYWRLKRRPVIQGLRQEFG